MSGTPNLVRAYVACCVAFGDVVTRTGTGWAIATRSGRRPYVTVSDAGDVVTDGGSTSVRDRLVDFVVTRPGLVGESKLDNLFPSAGVVAAFGKLQRSSKADVRVRRRVAEKLVTAIEQSWVSDFAWWFVQQELQ